jgi:hypothetical protein
MGSSLQIIFNRTDILNLSEDKQQNMWMLAEF